MAKTYTEEQLNTFDKATLIQLLLMQQSQLQEIDKKLQLLLEQAAVLKNNRFGKKSEKLGIENQVCFMEVDGDIVFFNEAEAVNASCRKMKKSLLSQRMQRQRANEQLTSKTFQLFMSIIR